MTELVQILMKESTFGSWTPEKIKNQNSYLKCWGLAVKFTKTHQNSIPVIRCGVFAKVMFTFVTLESWLGIPSMDVPCGLQKFKAYSSNHVVSILYLSLCIVSYIWNFPKAYSFPTSTIEFLMHKPTIINISWFLLLKIHSKILECLHEKIYLIFRVAKLMPSPLLCAKTFA